MASLKLTCLKCAQINKFDLEKVSHGPKCSVCGGQLITSKAIELDPTTLAKASRNDDLLLVIDFWAPWCGPCKIMGPQFSQAAQSSSGSARFVKLNTDTFQKAVQKYNIKGIPTLLGFKNGKEVFRKSGTMDAKKIQALVKKYSN